MAGNSFADEVAEQIAKLIQPDCNIQKQARRNDILGFNVAKRIAIIQAEIWDGNDPADRIFELEFLPKEQPANQSTYRAQHMLKAVRCGHRLVPTTRGYKCTTCLQHRAKTNFAYWSKFQCCPRPCATQVLKRRRKLVESSEGNQTPLVNLNSNNEHEPEQSVQPTVSDLEVPKEPTVDKVVGNQNVLVALTRVGEHAEEQTGKTDAATASGDGANRTSTEQKQVTKVYCPLDDEDYSPPLEEDFDPFEDEGYIQPEEDDEELSWWSQEDNHATAGSSIAPPPGICQAQTQPANPTPLRGKRLTKKTAPEGTPYFGVRILGTKAAQAKRREKVKEIIRQNNIGSKQAAMQGWKTVERNLATISEMVDKHGLGEEMSYDHTVSDQIHKSHDIKPIRDNVNAVYCIRCGAWSSGAHIKALRATCEGIVRPARAFQHRLLQLGITPVAGARIPTNARKKRRRIR